jgi:hypothetical protein
MNYQEATFAGTLRRVWGVSRVLGSGDFIGALIGTVVGVYELWSSHSEVAFLSQTPLVFAGVSAAIMALALASLSIVASTASSGFVRFLKSVKTERGATVHDDLLFHFWFTAGLSGASLIVDIGAYVVQLTSPGGATLTFLVGLVLFFLVYSVLAVLMLIGTATRWGMYRAEYLVVSERAEAGKDE